MVLEAKLVLFDNGFPPVGDKYHSICVPLALKSEMVALLQKDCELFPVGACTWIKLIVLFTGTAQDNVFVF